MKVLLVKTSSLGDVINTLPAVNDAFSALPDLQLDWLVESSYQQIPAWHPQVRRVVSGEFRRWRKTPFQPDTRAAWQAFKHTLQAERYDLILDAQGLIKSAFLTLFAHGPRAGRGWKTIPEKPAALCWQRSFNIDPSASEVHKVRQLLAGLLGYPEPSSPSRFGLSHATFTHPYAAPYVFFAHGAGWDSKLWPVEHWQALAKKLGAEGLTVVLTWGNAAEKQRAEAIAGVCAGVVLAGLDLSSLGAWLAHARLVVGLDTGLSHLAVALGTPTVCLYGPSVPVLLDQPHLINLCATAATTVVRDRPNTLPYAPVAEAVEHVLRGT